MTAPAIRPPSALIIGTARTVTAAFTALAGGLAFQLARHDLLAGGSVARAAIRGDESIWRLPHFIANGVSLAGGTIVGPTLLLALAAVVSVRERRWRPLGVTVAAVLLLDLCILVGKVVVGFTTVSGPATATIVCWGVGGWLVHNLLETRLRRTLHGVAASAALAVGVAQLYLNHPLPAVVTSWLLGSAIVGLLALLNRNQPAATTTR